MVTFSVVGIVLLAAAVHELAGPKPALIAAWILAIEPANIFFSSLLHKEPIMYLAEGLVVYGGALLWQRGKLVALLPMIFGCLLAVATRPYVGWFLMADVFNRRHQPAEVERALRNARMQQASADARRGARLTSP